VSAPCMTCADGMQKVEQLVQQKWKGLHCLVTPFCACYLNRSRLLKKESTEHTSNVGWRNSSYWICDNDWRLQTD
jgi:hypothetical protein